MGQNDYVRLTNGKIVYGGPLAGDYTIPVASRIPSSVFEEIERNGSFTHQIQTQARWRDAGMGYTA